MSEKMILKMRELLLKRRREIFELVGQLESGQKDLEERVIEPVDEAQKEELNRLFYILDKRGWEEIKEINLALERMAAGTYGICELCSQPISSKRLKVLPATRLCRQCAQKYEEAQEMRQHPRDEIVDAELLDEYRNLNDDNAPLKTFKLPHNESSMDLEEV